MPINRILITAANHRTLRNNPWVVEDFIHKINRRMDGIWRILRIIITSIITIS